MRPGFGVAFAPEWTHTVCDTCWQTDHPLQKPARMYPPGTDKCCFCGATTDSGIFLRVDPKDRKLRCKGVHRQEATT